MQVFGSMCGHSRYSGGGATPGVAVAVGGVLHMAPLLTQPGGHPCDCWYAGLAESGATAQVGSLRNSGLVVEAWMMPR